jgi:cell division protein FtsL
MPGLASPAKRRWRNLPVVREYDATRGRGLWALLFGIVVAALPVIGYLVEQNSYVRIRYRIEELRHRHEELRNQERGLRLEKAALEALPRVETIARDTLGLERPRPEQKIVLRRGSPGRGALDSRSPATTATGR